MQMLINAMKVFICLVVLVACVVAEKYEQTLKVWDENDDLGKIVNRLSPRPNSFPFLARLKITFNGDATKDCGGALINSQFILTAAHCVVDDERGNATEIQVLLGAHNLRKQEPSRITRYSASFITANYSSKTNASDVALIKLSQPVDFNQFIQPICLALEGSSYTGLNAIVAGWGAIRTDMPRSDVLLVMALRVLDDSVCARAYGRTYQNSVMLCAGSIGGTGESCQGDSGGPLFVRGARGFTSFGVGSLGMGCAGPGFHGVYAEVQQFVSWIIEHSAEGGSVCEA